MSRIVKGCIVGLFCICLVLSVNTVYGSQMYQFEAASDYLSQDMDTVEITGYGLSATYYFKNVEVGNHPLAEAAFMEKASSICVPAGLTNIETNYGLDADGSILGAELTYIHPTHSIYTKASFSTMDSEDDNSVSKVEISQDEYALGVGMYLQDGMLVSFE